MLKETKKEEEKKALWNKKKTLLRTPEEGRRAWSLMEEASISISTWETRRLSGLDDDSVSPAAIRRGEKEKVRPTFGELAAAVNGCAKILNEYEERPP